MRYFALGDSLTLGSGAGSAGSWAQQLANLWRGEGRAVEFHNLARSGYTSDQLLSREVPQLPDARPDDRVSVAIGTNDVSHLTPVGHYQDQLRAIYTALSHKGYAGPQCFALPQPDWSETYDGRRRGSARVLELIHAYNDALEYETITYGARYVDLWPLLEQQAAARLWSSGVHPNAAAYTQWARAVFDNMAGSLGPVPGGGAAATPDAPTPGGGGSSREFRWYGFPADRLGLVAHPRGTGFPLAVPLTPAQVFAQHPEVTTLACGPMFDGSDARPILGYRYFDREAGLDVHPTRHQDAGWTLSVYAGESVVLHGPEIASGASVAIQCPFAMVENGRHAWPDTAERNDTWRCAVGVLSDKRLIFAIGYTGLPTFTRRALATDYGPGVRLLWLLYLDGGHIGRVAQKDWAWGASATGTPGYLVERFGTPTATPPATSAPSSTGGGGGGGHGGRPAAPRPADAPPSLFVSQAAMRPPSGVKLAATFGLLFGSLAGARYLRRRR